MKYMFSYYVFGQSSANKTFDTLEDLCKFVKENIYHGSIFCYEEDPSGISEMKYLGDV